MQTKWNAKKCNFCSACIIEIDVMGLKWAELKAYQRSAWCIEVNCQ
jgi:hypothetical protein